MMRKVGYMVLAGLLFALPVATLAETDLPLPRFVSLKSDKVNMRTGPGLRYQIKWVYQRQHLPVEIIAEFDQWRKIRDMDGAEGWMHRAMLSGRRYAVVQTPDGSAASHAVLSKGGKRGLKKANVAANSMQDLHEQALDASEIIAKIEPGSIVSLEECRLGWCKISAKEHEGWIQRSALYGVYAEETLQ